MCFAREEAHMKVKPFITMRLYEAFSFLFVSLSFVVVVTVVARNPTVCFASYSI